MKGFTVTPVVLISIILIVGFMLIHFSTIDFWIANAIKQEGGMKKLQGDALKETRFGADTLFPLALYYAQYEQSEDSLRASLSAAVQPPASITVDFENDRFYINYNLLFSKSREGSISTLSSYRSVVEYPFKKLVDAYDAFWKSFPNDVSTYCGDVKSIIDGKKPTDIEISYTVSADPDDRCSCITGCRYWQKPSSYTVHSIRSYVKDTFSESPYIHINDDKPGECYILAFLRCR